MKWMIIDDEVIKCIKELKGVLNKYKLPVCLELGILEDLKISVWTEVRKK